MLLQAWISGWFLRIDWGFGEKRILPSRFLSDFQLHALIEQRPGALSRSSGSMLGLTHWKQRELAKASMAHGPATAFDQALLPDQVRMGLAVAPENSEKKNSDCK